MRWSCDEFWIELIHPAVAPMWTILDDLRSLWNSSSNQKQLECYKMWVWMWSLAASNELNFKWFCMILWICVIYLLHGSQPQSAKNREYFSICSSILSYFWLQILRTLYTVYCILFCLPCAFENMNGRRVKVTHMQTQAPRLPTYSPKLRPTCPIRAVGCQHTAPSSVRPTCPIRYSPKLRPACPIRAVGCQHTAPNSVQHPP